LAQVPLHQQKVREHFRKTDRKDGTSLGEEVLVALVQEIGCVQRTRRAGILSRDRRRRAG
jgi:hypothetical protein